VKTLVDQGTRSAAVLTSLTMDRAMETLVKGMKDGSQPPEQTYVGAESDPSVEELVNRNRALTT